MGLSGSGHCSNFLVITANPSQSIVVDPDSDTDPELEFYFVAEREGKIVGCGGFNFSGNPQVGKISWDIIHPDFQGKSIGTFLLNYRLNLLKKSKDLQKIIVRTSQHAYRFYEKNGIRVMEKKAGYWAPGFDLYLMEYKF